MTLSLRQPLVPIVEKLALAMPDQNLRAPYRDLDAPGIRPDRRTLTLRALVLLVPLIVTCGLGWLSLSWFALDGRLTLAEGALVGVTVFAFYWVVLSVATATLGLFWRPKPHARPLHGLRVAILLPMYGEPADTTVTNAVDLLAALPAKGPHRFALHVLSDTRDRGKVLLEIATVAALCKAHPALDIRYRQRADNIDYKSGNIRDWVQNAGLLHDAMLILDADSIMGAETVERMADALAVEPGLGLIQTIPRVLPGETLWQNMQSFASEVYGTNIGRGFALWTGVEGNFLGHNALVRIRAFAASAGLPHLPGAAPRGGVILSHDFVEAALLCRAGWGVRMMPEAKDSFEDTPEALQGYLRRDRRWCQGNMQHLRLITAPGLRAMSRFHLLQGAMAYLASVWWLVLLTLWALPVQGVSLGGVVWDNPLLPVLPSLPPVTQGAIAVVVGFMLIAPKLLGVAGHIRDHGLSHAQAPGFAAAVLAEALLSAMIAPMLMVHQVRSVLRMLAGFDGGWAPHRVGRSDLASLARFHATETLIGFGLLALAVAGQLSPWLLPVAVSLCLSVPLAALVQAPGRGFRHLGPTRKSS